MDPAPSKLMFFPAGRMLFVVINMGPCLCGFLLNSVIDVVGWADTLPFPLQFLLPSPPPPWVSGGAPAFTSKPALATRASLSHGSAKRLSECGFLTRGGACGAELFLFVLG